MRRETVPNLHGVKVFTLRMNGVTMVGVAATTKQAWDKALEMHRLEAERRVEQRQTLSLSQA
tara:strand:+ start:68 stop:253 length:186 start_codon:yes stop_codon:yes gene_type:complete